MDGRVKTLHPNVHGGLLAIRDNEDHRAAAGRMASGNRFAGRQSLSFEATVAGSGDYAACVENIDIGGPADPRSGKNHNDVAVLVDAHYDATLEALKTGGTDLPYANVWPKSLCPHGRLYHGDLNWMAGTLEIDMPPYRAFGGKLKRPAMAKTHQQGFYIGDAPALGSPRQPKSKARPCRIIISTTRMPFELVAEFDPTEKAACAIIKHANPCVATGRQRPMRFKKR